MNEKSSKTFIIWRITDNRPGHDNQSTGLIEALRKKNYFVNYEINASKLKYGLIHYFLKNFPPGSKLPRPDLIIGCGHNTHMSILCAKRAFGGKSVVIMKPGLPLALFDYCIIPDHDKPPKRKNVFVTSGAINPVRLSSDHDDSLGLILIGGPSRHCDWDEKNLLDQISTIVSRNPQIVWTLSDSPRTPEPTRTALSQLKYMNLEFHDFQRSEPGWLYKQLLIAGQVWVSADSLSMIYESLSSGAATGILDVPKKRHGKIARYVESLRSKKMITIYTDWQQETHLSKPVEILCEAERAADFLLESIG